MDSLVIVHVPLFDDERGFQIARTGGDEFELKRISSGADGAGTLRRTFDSTL